jgi:uncharacterized protein (DUF1778 family)
MPYTRQRNLAASRGNTVADPPTGARGAASETGSTTREARLEIRLTQEQKSLVVRAAAVRGATVTDFVRQIVQDAAAQVVADHDLLRLCAEDQEAFAAALLTPREPTEGFETAYEDYRKRVGV